MFPIASIDVNGDQLNLFGCRYRQDDAPAFVLVTERGEAYSAVSANVPGYPLAPDEVLVKTWSENAKVRGPLLNCGVFSDTGKRVSCGFVEAEVWKVLQPTKH